MINCGCPFGDYVAKHVLEGKMTFIGLGIFGSILLVICAVFMRVNTGALAAASSSGPSVETERKSLFSYKATWLLALLFIPMCTPYWGIPVVWPQYSSFLQFDAGQMSTVQLWVGLVGFFAIIGGVVSDGILAQERGHCPRPRRLPQVLHAGFFSRYAPWLFLRQPADGDHNDDCGRVLLCRYRQLPALPPLVFPPDPDLNGKVSSLLTFIGNSPYRIHWAFVRVAL